MPIPLVRTSLVTKAVKQLRAGILRGEYGEYLLPERQLSIALNISRPTLRSALKLLEKKGVLVMDGRKGRKILSHGKKLSSLTSGTVVRLLQEGNETHLLHEHIERLAFLTSHLFKPKFDFYVETSPACFRTNPKQALQALALSRPTHLWILYRSTKAMQQWFYQQNIPCIVLGSAHPGMDLVSLDSDYYAVCRHAAGLFLSKGHSRLAIVTPQQIRPGDQASCSGFEEAIQTSQQKNIQYYKQTHNETVPGICQAVNKLLKLPKPPTGWLIFNARSYFTISTQLAQCGITIGKEISLICRNSDPYFDTLIPSVACYKRNVKQMNQRLFKIIRLMLKGGSPKKRAWRIQPHFCNGDSLQSNIQK